MFQALGLDISIINDEGKTIQLKEIEEAEDREDNKLTVEELDKSPAVEVKDEETDDTVEDMEEEFEEIEEDIEEGADL